LSALLRNPGRTERTRCRLTPVKAIRAFCMECMGGSRKAVAECTSLDCKLHSYRMGRNPARAGIGGRPGPKVQAQKKKAVASATN